MEGNSGDPEGDTTFHPQRSTNPVPPVHRVRTAVAGSQLVSPKARVVASDSGWAVRVGVEGAAVEPVPAQVDTTSDRSLATNPDPAIRHASDIPSATDESAPSGWGKCATSMAIGVACDGHRADLDSVQRVGGPHRITQAAPNRPFWT